jgi:hypothetical protein
MSALRALARARPTASFLTSTTRTAAPRAFSQTALKRAGDHGGHESHYDPPTGWLFGVRPGEEYKKEGWENVTFYAFIPMMVVFVGVYAFKPDTRFVLSLFCCFGEGSMGGGGVREKD